MRRFNWNTAELTPWAGAPEGFGGRSARIGEPIGGEHLGGMFVELAPGDRMTPYHWEAAQEEWLIVVSGRPTVRVPDERRELRAGDVVCFPCGEAGAHQVINESGEPARVIMLSDRREPNVIVYPDSGKVGVRTKDMRGNYPLAADVPYWEGES